MSTLFKRSLELLMKVKDIPKIESMNNLKINVFVLNKTILSRIYINQNYLKPQIDLLLYENHCCPKTKMHCLMNKNSHMKHVCRRCLTVFSSIDIPYQHMERCNTKPATKISLSWKDHLTFEDHHMKIGLPFRVFADFECFNQPQNEPRSVM